MTHNPLPVAGYTGQTTERVDLVNMNKRMEEAVLRVLDDLATAPEIDRRWLAVGRTHIEQGFMAINRAIFQPTRVILPEDLQAKGAQDA
jgi:hypothetical protein